MRLRRDFFNRSTIKVARELLGKYLVRKINDIKILVKIVETEAYCGPEDKASHAYRGLTNRTRLMFGPPGYSYVYMIYGMYFCLNIVTEQEGYPAAVLIRGGYIVKGSSGRRPLNGPGKLCRELKINKTLNGINICNNKELWFTEGEKIDQSSIISSKRIGVDYAGKWKDKLWRFSIKS